MLAFEELVRLKQRIVAQVNHEGSRAFSTLESQEDKRVWLSHLRRFANEFDRVDYPFSYSTYLYTCFEHKPLLVSLQNQVFVEHMTTEDRIRLLHCICRTRSIAQDPCVFVWIATNMTRVQNDSMMSTLIDELVRRWNVVKMRNTRFNPIEMILNESIEMNDLLPFVRDELQTLMTTAPARWGIESVRRMISLASQAAYRFIALHIPVESLDLFQDDLGRRASQFVDESQNSEDQLSELLPRQIYSVASNGSLSLSQNTDTEVAHAQSSESIATNTSSTPNTSSPHTPETQQTPVPLLNSGGVDTVNISFRHRKNIKQAGTLDASFECPVCTLNAQDTKMILLMCGHHVCETCLDTITKTSKHCKCPLCRQHAIPCFVESIIPESKIARLDIFDKQDVKIGSIELDSAPKMLTSLVKYRRDHSEGTTRYVPSHYTMTISPQVEEQPTHVPSVIFQQ